jgi:hypothetical protein
LEAAVALVSIALASESSAGHLSAADASSGALRSAATIAIVDVLRMFFILSVV